MDVERGILSSIVKERSLTPVLEAKIREDHFTDEQHRMVFRWMRRWQNDYQAEPTAKALKEEFPTYKLLNVHEPLQYYIDLKVAQIQRNMVLETVEDAGAAITDEDTHGAVVAMGSGLQRFYENDGSSTTEDFVETVDKRMAYYDWNQDRDESLVGIPTGFPSLDSLLNGFQPEQFIVITGLQGAGKSYELLKMAQAAQDAGNRVFFLSFEMSILEQQMRYDCMRAGLNYRDLQRPGALNNRERQQLRDAMEATKDLPAFIMEHDRAANTTVSAIGAKIPQTRPDIVFVDGVYLMDPEDPKAIRESAQAITTITRAFKRLAQRVQLPIVGSTQALPGKTSKRSGLDLWSIGYSSSFGQDADVVIGIEPDKDDQRLALLNILKARNAPPDKIYLWRDWTHSEIREYEKGAEDWHGSDNGIAVNE